MKKFLFVYCIILFPTITLAQNHKAGTDKKIRTLLIKICDKKSISYKSMDSLIFLEKQNEIVNDINNKFPNSDKDDSLFFCFIKKINKLAVSDYKFEFYIIKLSLIIKYSAEQGEYVSGLIPYLALDNTEGFLRSYVKLSNSQKKIILSDLLFLKEINKQNDFIKNLSVIKNRKIFDKEIEEIKRKLLD